MLRLHIWRHNGSLGVARTRTPIHNSYSRSRSLFKRFASSVSEEEESLDYSTRKGTISASPEKYYPPIYSARNSISGGLGELIRIEDFRVKFDSHDFSQYPQKRHPDTFIVEGKIKSIRKSGKAMYFIDLIQDDKKLQVMASNKLMNMSKDEFDEIHQFFKKGDFIICTGAASTTNVGELTIKLNKPVSLLSPRLTMVPNRLVDRGLINSNRVLNYLANEESRNPILIKSWITQSIRAYLLENNFLEVQTPLLAGAGTGANAQPFITRAKAISSVAENELQLRVAPELWLKRLVVSGFDKIFEIGTNFRNEGVDATHNPEFTTCEFYKSYTGLLELMKMTEELFRYIHHDLSKKDALNLKHTLPKLNFPQEFPKYEFVPTLEAKTGQKLPTELTSSNLVEYYTRIGLAVPENLSPHSLLDNLSGVYLEAISNETPNTPIIIYNQPAVLSPLAKSAKISYGVGMESKEYEISLRFELFINGKEYVNSYEEENSPYEQLAKFKLQQHAKSEFNDADLLIPDWEFIKAIELGLPPTGGWGCGIDRIAMLFSGVERIDSVLPFGNVRDVKKQ
ncbi:class II aaRS and biotin synthetase [Suhomyces tanzawaensis NRRL Y-17324]|uniref:Lysyl-tRNA synthetase n=1 Tax=Suhomyces tanzawaensis NRRL Y-17324 TaxID=984487 RepID=A0A1E4SHU3_9ASCO|nr:class II aaRS and biotin synthetase [Suhomyces tanzawaensis NRRL Y-17324]ODV79065.1 class II aaRS and biotin synthetase [Suhomyces tanzawaensis NRRL Y-17324]